MLVGRYRLEEPLGQGAMGEVWKARDIRLDRAVAVKVLRDHLTSETSKVRRFRAEARIGAGIQHPGIAVVFDADEHQGRLFFVMELLTGENLAQLMSRCRNGLPIGHVAVMGEQIADALAGAHAAGIVHRDIKPANIMIIANGRIKICDFGVARMLSMSGGQMTSGIGTAAYMAPEQFDGDLDQRADLYSLGCVLYEALTGDQPFVGSPQQLMYQHITANPIPPSAIRGEIPEELEELVLALMRKDPATRPKGAEEVAATLRAWSRTRRSLAPEPDPPTARMNGGHTTTHRDRPYEPPPLRLLKSGTPARQSTEDNEMVLRSISTVLAREHVDAKVSGYVRGPSSSRYEIRLGPTCKPSDIAALTSRITAALDGREILVISGMDSTSPLPDVRAVGVVIPNAEVDVVSLGDVLRDLPDPDRVRSLTVGLGRDMRGAAVAADLTRVHHLLIAGDAENISGDPLRPLITSILIGATPEQVRMVLADSRSKVLAPFRRAPHLLKPVSEDPLETVAILQLVLAELHRRYDDLSAAHCRTVQQYNRQVADGRIAAPMNAIGDESRPHPHLLVVIGELSEVLRTSPKQVEKDLAELAQLGRAAGIHMLIRTARPDGRTVTQRIKAHIPGRLSMSVATTTESLRMLDHPGADTLGTGEAFFRGSGGERPRRLQLARVSADEIGTVVDEYLSQTSA